ncbi:transcriptional corepressor SEUSS-like, partial [Trifolium medium]|nr:transcriptional corepressor SEUSS-like [Trifolium medium]
GLGPSGLPNGMRPGMGNNSVMNGRGGMASMAREQAMNHQQDLSSQLLSGMGNARFAISTLLMMAECSPQSGSHRSLY